MGTSLAPGDSRHLAVLFYLPTHFSVVLGHGASSLQAQTVLLPHLACQDDVNSKTAIGYLPDTFLRTMDQPLRSGDHELVQPGEIDLRQCRG